MEGVSLEGTAGFPRGITTTLADFRPGFFIFAVPLKGGLGKEIDLESDCV